MQTFKEKKFVGAQTVLLNLLMHKHDLRMLGGKKIERQIWPFSWQLRKSAFMSSFDPGGIPKPI